MLAQQADIFVMSLESASTLPQTSLQMTVRKAKSYFVPGNAAEDLLESFAS